MSLKAIVFVVLMVAIVAAGQPVPPCAPCIPDAVSLRQSYCVSIDDDFYTILVAHATGQLPVLIIHSGCGDPCTNPDCTPLDLSHLTVTVFPDHIELLNEGDCGCFCLSFDHYLPVQLMSFEATAQGPEILVQWATASETEISRFFLERSQDNLTWERVANVTARGGSGSGQSYSFRDTPTREGRYTYRLSTLSPNGSIQVQPQIATAEYSRTAELPQVFALEQNYPNPFNPETSIRYALPGDGNVTLAVYDVMGRLVNTLVSGEQAAGVHTVNFSGADLSSGVYVYRLQSGAQVLTEKMMLIK